MKYLPKKLMQFSIRFLFFLTVAAAVLVSGYQVGFRHGREARQNALKASFDDLIKLIETTVAPESWGDTPTPPDIVCKIPVVTTMDEDGRLSRKIVRRSIHPEELRAELLFRSPLQHSSTMGRTDILRAYGYREEFAVCDDLDLYTRLSARYKIGSLPEVLVRRRHYGGQFTRTAEERMNQETKEIFARQLTELGIAFTVEDLERHLRLRGALGLIPDLEYLEWADAWLRRLKEANNRTRQYAEPWFTHVLQERWFKTCRRASGDLGWVAWRRFWQSPLRSGIWQLALRKLPGTGSQVREYSRASASNS